MRCGGRNSLAAVDLATGRHHTYQAFDDRISRLAGSFRDGFRHRGRRACRGPGAEHHGYVRSAICLWPYRRDFRSAELAAGEPGITRDSGRLLRRRCWSTIRNSPSGPSNSARGCGIEQLGFTRSDVRADRAGRTAAGSAGGGDPGRHLDHSLHIRHDRAAQGRDHYAWHEFLEHRAQHEPRRYPALDGVSRTAAAVPYRRTQRVFLSRRSRPAAQ